MELMDGYHKGYPPHNARVSDSQNNVTQKPAGTPLLLLERQVCFQQLEQQQHHITIHKNLKLSRDRDEKS